jgi:hypothetical protein
VDLEPDGPLAGDQVEVVEGVDVHEPLRCDELARLFVGVVPDGSLKDDLGAVASGRGHLRGGGVLRHADHRPDAEHRGGERHALGVVSGRGADDAAIPLLLGEARELHERPANLVRPRALEELGLQAHVEAGFLAQEARAEQRRPVDVGPDVLKGGLRVRRDRDAHLGEAYSAS